MGKACCGAKQTTVYTLNGKTQSIPAKDLKTLDRFAAGAVARIETKNKKMELAKEIAGKYLRFFITFDSIPSFRYLTYISADVLM